MMDSTIETLFCVILSRILQIHCYTSNTELFFTSNCSSSDYEIHYVGRSQTYDLVFRGRTPPETCKIGFYQGLDGEVCVEATSYDVRDCDINLRFSTNSLKYYSCVDRPITKKCTDYGSVLDVTLSTESQLFGNKVQYQYSSFTLHITQGEGLDALTSSLGSVLVILIVIGVIICMLAAGVAFVRRVVQRNPFRTSGSTISQTPAVQQQPATGITIHHPVQPPFVQGYGPPSGYGNRPMQPQGYEPMIFHGYGPSTSAQENRSLTTDVHRQQIPQTYSPSLAHGQRHQPGQDRVNVVEKGHHQDTDQSAPPPSYEEAVKYDA